jgi:hypothetical protein
VSAGPGRLQRKILKVLAIHAHRYGPGTWVSRRVLQEILIAEGHTPSNITRSLRSLQRKYEIELVERLSLDDSRVRPAPPAKPIPDAEVFAILREARHRGDVPPNPGRGHTSDVPPMHRGVQQSE